MSSKTLDRLTPGQRLSRGLKYSAVGPVDVTRGAVGLGVDSVRTSAGWAGDRYRRSRLAKQVKSDIAAAQDIIASLPDALGGKARRSRNRRRTLLIAGVGIAVLAGGAAAFSIIRRSSQPEPSPLPPSVEVTPKP